MEKKKDRIPNLERVGKHFEWMDFYIFACEGEMRKVFDILACDKNMFSIHPVSGSMRLIKVQVDNISRTVEKAVRGYETHVTKEIWLIKYGEKEKHPGIAHVFRYSGSKLTTEPQNLPLKSALRKEVKL